MKRQKYPRINLCLVAGTIFLLSLAFAPSALGQNDVEGATVLRVEALQSQGHWVESLRLLRTQVQQNPRDTSTQIKLLDLLMWTRNVDEARNRLASLQALMPGQLNVLLWQTQLAVGPLVSQGNADQEAGVLPYLEGLLEQSEADPSADLATRLYLDGMIQKFHARPEEAEERFLRALYANPNFLPALEALTDTYVERHQSGLAADQLAHALDLSPNNADHFYLAGRIFLEKNDPARALEHFQRSRQWDPLERPKRLYWQAEAERLLGKSEDAARDYRMVLSYWPNRADIWTRYAASLDAQHHEPQAIRAYQRAYQLQPSALEPLIEDARRQFWTQSLDQVLHQYQRLFQIAPDQSRWMLLLSDIQYARWLNGEPLSTEALETLARQIRQHVDYPSPPLQLAVLQLHAVSLNGWTPELKAQVARVSREARSPFTQALCQLLLGYPIRAKTLNQTLPLPENLDFELQRWALHHFWPLPQAWVSEAARLNPYWLNWEGQDRQKAEALIQQAQIKLYELQPLEAEALIQQAQRFYPLLPDIYYLQAQARLKQQDPMGAEQALQTAMLLGFNSPAPKVLERFQKQVSQAKRRLKSRP